MRGCLTTIAVVVVDDCLEVFFRLKGESLSLDDFFDDLAVIFIVLAHVMSLLNYFEDDNSLTLLLLNHCFLNIDSFLVNLEEGLEILSNLLKSQIFGNHFKVTDQVEAKVLLVHPEYVLVDKDGEELQHWLTHNLAVERYELLCENDP